jgi:hypothetical protein
MADAKKGGMEPVKIVVLVLALLGAVALGHYFYSTLSLPAEAPSNLQTPALHLKKKPVSNEDPNTMPAATSGYLAMLAADGKATQCTVDLSKLAKPATEAGGAMMAKPSAMPKLSMMVKGKMMRSEAVMAGMKIVTIVDVANGVSYVMNPLAAMAGGMPKGVKNAYANCDWFSYKLRDLSTLAKSGASKSGVTDPDDLMSASKDAFSCKPGTFKDDVLAIPTVKVCEGKAFACDQMKMMGGAMTPEMTAYCK